MYRRIILFMLFPLFFLPFTLKSAPASRLMIVQNVGQYPSDIRYHTLGGSGSLWLSENALWWTTTDQILHVSFPGAKAHPSLQPAQPRPTHLSYYRGHEATQWLEGVPVFGRLQYLDLMPGVDLEILEQKGQIVLRASAALEMAISDGDTAPRAFTLQPGQPTPLEQVLGSNSAGGTIPARGATPNGSPLLFGTFLGPTTSDYGV